MSEYNLLLGGLRERAKLAAQEGNMTATCDARYFSQAADALEAMAGEVERLKSQRDEYLQFWKNNAEACEAAEAERDRLKAALEGMVHYAGHAGWWQDENPEYLEAARKALGGDA